MCKGYGELVCCFDFLYRSCTNHYTHSIVNTMNMNEMATKSEYIDRLRYRMKKKMNK